LIKPIDNLAGAINWLAGLADLLLQFLNLDGLDVVPAVRAHHRIYRVGSAPTISEQVTIVVEKSRTFA
jgi:hypothetical protein